MSILVVFGSLDNVWSSADHIMNIDYSSYGFNTNNTESDDAKLEKIQQRYNESIDLLERIRSAFEIDNTKANFTAQPNVIPPSPPSPENCIGIPGTCERIPPDLPPDMDDPYYGPELVSPYDPQDPFQ